MSKVESNKRLVWFMVIVAIILGANVVYAGVPQSTIRHNPGGTTTYVGHYGNFTESVESGAYFLGDVNVTETFYVSQGATATVGFNQGLDYLPNYWYCDGTADQVQINAATTYVSGIGGGTVLLEQGDYAIASTINIPTLTRLIGSGWDTVLLYNAVGDCVTFTGDDSGIFSLKIEIVAGAGAGNRPNGLYGLGRNNVKIDDVWIYGDRTIEGGSDYTQRSGVVLLQTNGSVISNSVIENARSCGISMMDKSRSNMIYGNTLKANGYAGVYLHDNLSRSSGYIVSNNVVLDSYYGIMLHEKIDDSTIIGNTLRNNSYGIAAGGYTTSDGVAFIGNTISDSTVVGLSVINIRFSTISGNTLIGNGNGGLGGIFLGGGFQTSAVKHITVTGNSIYDTDGPGIYLQGGTYVTITGNNVYRSTEHGIALASGGEIARYLTVSSNTCVDNDYLGTDTYDGISFVSITDSIITDNIVRGNDRFGISLDDSCTDNIVNNNYIESNWRAGFMDNGTDTRLSTLILPFVDGTTFLSSAPFGWEIDVNTEYAVVLGTLPEEVQQVVSWKIYATSVVTETHNMTLQVLGYGGADNQAYTTETVSIATLNSTSLNFAANDVIYWTITASDDTDLDEMFGGDQIMIQVLHEAASGGACETDAVFTCIEIEYV